MPHLQKLDDALWLVDGETVSFYGFPYPTRRVIVLSLKSPAVGVVCQSGSLTRLTSVSP